VVIATSDHGPAITAALAARGIDVARAIADRQLVALDAADTLARFMVDGRPERESFRAVVTAALDAARDAGHDVIRCFGEMVELLWRESVEAAIQLEELWNERLLVDPRISLLCAYRIDVFERHVQGALHRVSQVHSHVLPVLDSDRFDEAVDRAFDDVFGSSAGDTGTLRRLIMSHHPPVTAMPERHAALFALREVSTALAGQVLERGRHYYATRTWSAASGGPGRPAPVTRP
jgi:hypothetical protein